MTDPTPSLPEPGLAESKRRPTRPGGRRRGLALLGLLAGAVLLGGCQLPPFWSFRGVTRQEHDTFLLYSGTVIAAIVVGVFTAGLILFAIVRYRRRSDEMPRQFQYHIPLEILYTVVPIIIVLILFVFTVVTENKVDALTPKPAVSVKITAFQWGWKFDYTGQRRYVEGIRTEDPDPVGTHGRTCDRSAPNSDYCLGPGLVVPVGKTVSFSLVSNDVIHSFYVPQFLFSRQALPGVDNRFDFTVNRTGIYRAQCNNICGLYHSQMFFHVVALPPAQFTAWVHGSQTLPDSEAAALPSGRQSAVTPVPAVNPYGTAGTGRSSSAGTATGSAPGTGSASTGTSLGGSSTSSTGGL